MIRPGRRPASRSSSTTSAPDRPLQGPKAVEFLDELPKTSTGKVRKYELREREWAGQEPGSRAEDSHARLRRLTSVSALEKTGPGERSRSLHTPWPGAADRRRGAFRFSEAPAKSATATSDTKTSSGPHPGVEVLPSPRCSRATRAAAAGTRGPRVGRRLRRRRVPAVWRRSARHGRRRAGACRDRAWRRCAGPARAPGRHRRIGRQPPRAGVLSDDRRPRRRRVADVQVTWRCLAELADDTAAVAEILGRDRRPCGAGACSGPPAAATASAAADRAVGGSARERSWRAHWRVRVGPVVVGGREPLEIADARLAGARCDLA